MPRMVTTHHDNDTRRDTLRRAHRHYRRMNAAHPDWGFAQSLRIEFGKARSVSAQMARIRAGVLAHVSKEEV